VNVWIAVSVRNGENTETEFGWPRAETAKVAMNLSPEDGKRSRGRRQKTWRMTFAEDLQGMGVTWRGAESRQRWRNLAARCYDKNARTFMMRCSTIKTTVMYRRLMFCTVCKPMRDTCQCRVQ